MARQGVVDAVKLFFLVVKLRLSLRAHSEADKMGMPSVMLDE